jgi:2'-5' RNA ligase
MQKPMVSLPGYRVHEYLLVINPNAELRQQIQAIKEDFAKKYNAPLAFGTRPHVSLVKFSAYEMAEAKIINRFGMIATGIQPFKIELRDFGSFPSHTIYVNLVTKVALQELVRDLKQAQRLLTLSKDEKPHFIEEPHLTICRKLKPWQYEKGWLEYSHRHFSGRFIADSMVLLKRLQGEKGYQAIMRFEFKSVPVLAKQGSLFL